MNIRVISRNEFNKNIRRIDDISNKISVSESLSRFIKLLSDYDSPLFINNNLDNFIELSDEDLLIDKVYISITNKFYKDRGKLRRSQFLDLYYEDIINGDIIIDSFNNDFINDDINIELIINEYSIRPTEEIDNKIFIEELDELGFIRANKVKDLLTGNVLTLQVYENSEISIMCKDGKIFTSKNNLLNFNIGVIKYYFYKFANSL